MGSLGHNNDIVGVNSKWDQGKSLTETYIFSFAMEDSHNLFKDLGKLGT